MDSSSSSSISPQEQQQLQRFLQQEEQRQLVREMVTKITSVCWDKCITSTPGNKFSSSESTCLSNCSRRFGDVAMIINTRFGNPRG